MEHPKQHKRYLVGSKCSVKECENIADYEPVLYDYYSHIGEVFYEQDFTCPFICEQHMLQNEKQAKGERKPSGTVYYPFTNRGHAQGYTKYVPIKELYPQLFEDLKIESNQQFQSQLKNINEELIEYLQKHPDYLRQLNPRRFEELIALIFENNGYKVELTPETRDGGKDIIATYSDIFGHSLFIIECKQRKHKKVGVEMVNRLYGVQKQGKYHKAFLVTTTSFSQPAKDFVIPIKEELILKDSNDIEEWIRKYKKATV